jgi:hypothetical protein
LGRCHTTRSIRRQLTATCTVAGSLDDALIGEALALLEQAWTSPSFTVPRAAADALGEGCDPTLKKRGEKKTVQMRDIVQSQRKRIQDTQKKKEKEVAQLALFEDERKQLDADKRYWQPRLGRSKRS